MCAVDCYPIVPVAMYSIHGTNLDGLSMNIIVLGNFI